MRPDIGCLVVDHEQALHNVLNRMEADSIPCKNEMVILHIIRRVVVESHDGLHLLLNQLSILLCKRPSPL